LRDSLEAAGCEVVAMESTGVYWKPIYNILADGRREVLVVNAAHIKTVPDRKTDVKDAEWMVPYAGLRKDVGGSGSEEGLLEEERPGLGGLVR
jgi:transposase